MVQFFFGDKNYSYDISKHNNILCSDYFKDSQLAFLQEQMELSSLIILKQVHGINGLIIKEPLINITLRTFEGDFLITNQKNIGLGLLTADCLPIIFYDEVKQVVAAAHAGWRGSVLKIAQKVITEMKLQFDCKVGDIQLFFGPAAQVCCYEVSDNFYSNALNDTLFACSIIKRGERLFFDNGLYNLNQLLSLGIMQDNVNYDSFLCTMCNDVFCSYRKDQKAQTRNITVVSLK